MTSKPTVQAIPTPGHDYYAIVVDDIPTTVAEVTPAAHDIDGDLVRPATIQFIWTPPDFRRRGHARLLVEHLLKLYPNLSHDGYLTEDGQALVERHNLPMREGKEPERYDPAAAEHLGRSTYDKVRAAWNVQNEAI
jgi:GNAT superfamily N-acetyltransferase